MTNARQYYISEAGLKTNRDQQDTSPDRTADASSLSLSSVYVFSGLHELLRRHELLL